MCIPGFRAPGGCRPEQGVVAYGAQACVATPDHGHRGKQVATVSAGCGVPGGTIAWGETPSSLP